MNAPSGNKEYNVKPVVIKRDGCQVPFDEARIAQAIERAALAVGVVDADCATVARVVAQRMEQQPRVDIHEIQQAVENQLMAGEYSSWRAPISNTATIATWRASRGRLNQEIRGLVEQSNRALLNENANKDSKVIPTQRDLLAGIVAKHYAKQHILPRDVVLAHERGEIHYHDLDYSPFFPMFNCMLIDLKGMLTNGFKMGNAEIEPPKSISTATAVTAQIIAQVASHIYGGTTINRIDEILAPFVDESFRKHLQVAEEWQIPDAKGYAMARRKSVTTPSSRWSTRSTPAHRQRPDAVRHLRLRPRHQLGVAPDPALDPENRIAGLGKTARPPCSPNWCSPSATASTTSTAIRTTTSNSWRWSAPASACTRTSSTTIRW